MGTTVGTESHLTDMLNNVLELQYDAIGAYATSIARLVTPEFGQDERRHCAWVEQAMARL